jgi:hypothetical protein
MIHDESGRFTLEATIIFPLVFIITLSCLFITIGATHHVGVYIDATSTAGRAAFSWTNSNKNPLTGAYFPENLDDLYWRISDDWNGSPLVEKKLTSSLSFIPARLLRNGLYNNYLLQRDIDVHVVTPFHAPAFMAQLYGSRELHGNGHSIVSEPVELIRQIELARTYWPMIKNVYSTEQADEAVEEFRKRKENLKDKPVFNTHDEARAYLQQMVHGYLDKRYTDEVGNWRLIDALDEYGVAHQAYYGFKAWNKEFEYQLLKDSEILRKGQVSGVVWHFFRRESDQTIGLNDKLRSQLEARGFVIVLHE